MSTKAPATPPVIQRQFDIIAHALSLIDNPDFSREARLRWLYQIKNEVVWQIEKVKR